MPRADFDALVKAWREQGPVAWAENRGWITEDLSPIVLTPWQRAVLQAWWDNRFDVTTLAVSNIKKTGKTTLNAILTCWRWLTLGGLHYVAANDFDQSQGRQFDMIAAACKHNSLLARSVAIGKDRLVFRPSGSELVALSTDPRGVAGSNHWTSSHTECWGILDSVRASVEHYGELTPPPGKRFGLPALRVADSYAGYDDSTTWHDLIDRGLAGEALEGDWPLFKAEGLLLFAMDGTEAQRSCFRGTPAERDAYYSEQRRSLRPAMFTRLHLNVRVSGVGDPLITEEEWARCEIPGLTPLGPCKDVPLYVGLDIGLKSDSTGVLALMPNGDGQARIALHRVWYPRKGTTLDLAPVGDYLRELHEKYWLVVVRFDPSQAQHLAAELRASGLPMRELVQSPSELGPRGTALYEAIRDGRLRTYVDEDLRKHFANCVAKECPQGLILRKASARRKVDLCVCASFVIQDATGRAGASPEAMASLMAGGDLAQESRWTDSAARQGSPYICDKCHTYGWTRCGCEVPGRPQPDPSVVSWLVPGGGSKRPWSNRMGRR